jgi:hypothetical protein
MALLSQLIGHEAVASLPDSELTRLSSIIDQHLITNTELHKVLQPKVNEALAAIRLRTQFPEKK